MWESLKTKAKNLVTKHGAEVGAVAKIAAHALIPGAPIMVGAVESLCDYAADKGQDLTDAKMTEMLESLGSDVQHLESLLGHLSGQLDGVLGQMSQMAGFGATPDILEKMMNSALESQFSTLRNELRGMSARFESVEHQNQKIIDHLSIEGDKRDELLSMLRELREEVAELKSSPADEEECNAAMERLYEARTIADLEALYSTLSGVGWSKELKQILRVVLFVLKGDHIKAREANRDLTRLGSPRAKTIARSVARVTEMGGPSRSASAEQSQHFQKLKAGDRLGSRGWTLKARIGDGGMGSVWRVENRFNEEAALKVIHAELNTDDHLLQRFQSEIKTLRSISHPAVIDVIDWGEERGIWYLVMPLIKGKSLASRLRSGHLDLSSTKAIARSIASALVACHAKGIIHRDIKPDNIMLKADGSPVLIDFGIAHQEGISKGNTGFSTAGFAPPEQQEGQTVDASADLFALGMTLAKCLGRQQSGQEPWASLINQLTHFMPDRRGTAQGLLDKLSEAPKKYFSNIPGQDPKGPFALKEVCAQVLAGANDLHLWWEGQSAWQKWDTVSEVKATVDKHRKPTPPPMPAQKTPPPPPAPPAPPKPQLKAGDRVESKVGGVSFYERVIPAPPGGKPFMIMETQVTQALYREVTGQSPSRFKGDQLPVEKVSWEDGIAFCNALSKKLGLAPAYKGTDNNCELISGANGFRLPFEAEWEFAAKGGQSFTYAGSNNIDEVAWYEVTTNDEGTRPVGTKKPNGYGLYDMSGNVWEWCADDYNNPGKHRLGASGRAYRGGSWNYDAVLCEVSNRNWCSPGLRDDDLGLRLSRSLA